MKRPWLVLLVVGCVLLAGCSLPGTGPADGGTGTDGGAGADGGTYPQGWNADGLANATLAIQAADRAIGEQDFVERRVIVKPNAYAGNRSVHVEVLEVQVDYDEKRLLSETRFYRVTNETARRIGESGHGVLDDRRPVEVKRTYFNASAGRQYHRLGNRSGVQPMESMDFAAATDQPMPALLGTALPKLKGATFTGSSTSGENVTYTVENVTADPFQRGAGEVTVRSNGLVPRVHLTQSGAAGPAVYTYELEPGDVTVESPEWNASAGNVPTGSPPGTATPGTAGAGTTGTTATASNA